MKTIHILTLFPQYFEPLKNCGVVGQALSGKRGELFHLNIVNIRDFAIGNYKAVDSYPYGGGEGMVLRADCLKAALDSLGTRENFHIVYPNPRGYVWTTSKAKDFAKRFSHEKEMVFICGRYEGIDERFLELYVDEHISLGDYILSGGELAVSVIIDSTLRFVPQVLGNKASAQNESFANDLIEHGHYTKPTEFEGIKVPDVLISGHHKKIDEFNISESLRLTKKYRPDLLEKQ